MTALSDKDLGKCICAGAGNEGLGRVERHVMNGLVVLLPVGRDLLHARPVVQHPQAHRAVVAYRGQKTDGNKDNKVMRGKDHCRVQYKLILYIILQARPNANALHCSFSQDCRLYGGFLSKHDPHFAEFDGVLVKEQFYFTFMV